VKRLTGGKGVDVVYDSVGKATWERSLNSLKPRGMMVTFGNASGPVDPFSPLVLNQKGSLYVTRPNLGNYTATREELLWRATDVLGWLRWPPQTADSRHLSAARGGPGASRPGEPQDNRQIAAGDLTHGSAFA